MNIYSRSSPDFFSLDPTPIFFSVKTTRYQLISATVAANEIESTKVTIVNQMLLQVLQTDKKFSTEFQDMFRKQRNHLFFKGFSKALEENFIIYIAGVFQEFQE